MSAHLKPVPTLVDAAAQPTDPAVIARRWSLPLARPAGFSRRWAIGLGALALVAVAAVIATELTGH